MSATTRLVAAVVPLDVAVRLRVMAAEQDRPMADLLREAIKNYMVAVDGADRNRLGTAAEGSSMA